jgi:acetyl esterase/lipase
MISEQARLFHEKIDANAARAAEAPAQPDMSAVRAAFGALSGSLGAPVSHTKEEVDADGVRAVWLVPDGAAGPTVVLFVHGGGYVACSPETHTSVATQLGRRLHARVLSVDYRLAPEVRFPGQIDDCLTVYQWLLGRGTSPEHIVLAGESAGASLCVTTQLAARAQQMPLPAAAYVMSPWLDLEALGASYERASNDLITRAGAVWLGGLYLGPRAVDRADELMCPLAASLRGLAPMFVQVGEDERLLDDARRLASHARRDDVACALDVVPRMRHLFQMNVGAMPEADGALDRAAEFVRRFVTGAGPAGRQ